MKGLGGSRKKGKERRKKDRYGIINIFFSLSLSLSLSSSSSQTPQCVHKNLPMYVYVYKYAWKKCFVICFSLLSPLLLLPLILSPPFLPKIAQN